MTNIKIEGPKVYAFDPRLRKYIRAGTKIGDVYFKNVSSKHFMRVVNGYGIQYDVIREMKNSGVKRIEILEDDTGKKWVASMIDWDTHSKTADYGHGKQVFLSLKYMQLKRRGE
jgi:hypothetical protein